MISENMSFFRKILLNMSLLRRHLFFSKAPWKNKLRRDPCWKSRRSNFFFKKKKQKDFVSSKNLCFWETFLLLLKVVVFLRIQKIACILEKVCVKKCISSYLFRGLFFNPFFFFESLFVFVKKGVRLKRFFSKDVKHYMIGIKFWTEIRWSPVQDSWLLQ